MKSLALQCITALSITLLLCACSKDNGNDRSEVVENSFKPYEGKRVTYIVQTYKSGSSYREDTTELRYDALGRINKFGNEEIHYYSDCITISSVNGVTFYLDDNHGRISHSTDENDYVQYEYLYNESGYLTESSRFYNVNAHYIYNYNYDEHNNLTIQSVSGYSGGYTLLLSEHITDNPLNINLISLLHLSIEGSDILYEIGTLGKKIEKLPSKVIQAQDDNEYVYKLYYTDNQEENCFVVKQSIPGNLYNGITEMKLYYED